MNGANVSAGLLIRCRVRAKDHVYEASYACDNVCVISTSRLLSMWDTDTHVSNQTANRSFCSHLLPLQFVEVSFAYDNGHVIYDKVDFGVDLDSRIALVGPNGAGKSTLLKLMTGELQSTDGAVKRHNHLRIGQYHQVNILCPLKKSSSIAMC